MKISIEGTASELTEAVERLRNEFMVGNVSTHYKNYDNDFWRVYVDAELPPDKYKTIICLKDDVSGNQLQYVMETIEKSFVNRAGSLRNISNNPYEFVFEGDEDYYGCLQLGMLHLAEIKGFIDYIKSFEWVDTDPNECCDMLEVFARHPLIKAEKT